jgi:hypothetical protein
MYRVLQVKSSKLVYVKTREHDGVTLIYYMT